MFALGSKHPKQALAERFGTTLTSATENQIVVRDNRGIVFFRAGRCSAWLLDTDYIELALANCEGAISLRESSPDYWFNRVCDLFLSSPDSEQFTYLGEGLLRMHEQGPNCERVGFVLSSPLSHDSWKAINLDSNFSVEYNYCQGTISQIKELVSETMNAPHPTCFRIRVLDYSGCRLCLYSFGTIGSLLYSPSPEQSALGVSIQITDDDERIERYAIPGNEPVEVRVKHLIPLPLACSLFLRYLSEGSRVFEGLNLVPQ